MRTVTGGFRRSAMAWPSFWRIIRSYPSRMAGSFQGPIRRLRPDPAKARLMRQRDVRNGRTCPFHGGESRSAAEGSSRS
jgi:hypothetical protein